VASPRELPVAGTLRALSLDGTASERPPEQQGMPNRTMSEGGLDPRLPALR